ncbi:MAG: AMP-binding protein [Acidimicrobiia bacterium]
MNLLEAFTLPKGGTATEIVFWDPDPVAFSSDQLAHDSERARNWYAQHYEPGETVAMLLTASASCCTNLFGAWRAGLTVASLPIPARGASMEHYARQLRDLVAVVGAREIFAEGTYCELLKLIEIEASPFEGIHSDDSAEDTDGATLVQFTSGTTSQPKGVVLPIERVLANATTIAQHLQIRDGEIAFSWLPWSHDMGLVGMLLVPLVANREVRQGALHVGKPEHFVANPGLWLQRCADIGASITAGPDFAMRVAVRAAQRSFSGSLERLRCVITGAEPIRTSTIEMFTNEFCPRGMRASAITPAYGLAEATLAVTIAPIDEVPMVVPTSAVDREGLATATLSASETFQVGCGSPLPGVDLGFSEDGIMSISGPSMMTGYLTEQGFTPAGSPFETRDVGVMRDGQLFVRGRHDDLLIVAGRKFFAHDVEAVVECLPGVHDGGCVTVGRERLDIIVESTSAEDSGAALEREIRSEVARHFGAPVGQVVIVPHYAVMKTTSGKKQRLQTALQYLQQ